MTLKLLVPGVTLAFAGNLEPSELNRTTQDLLASHARGREIADAYGLLDKSTVMAELEAQDPKLLQSNQAELDSMSPQDDARWHAMFQTGLLPWEVWDTAVREALQARRQVELIDPSLDGLEQFARCASINVVQATGYLIWPFAMPADVCG